MGISFYLDADNGDYLTIAVWDYNTDPVYAEGGTEKRAGDPAADTGNTTGWGLNNQFREIGDKLVDLNTRTGAVETHVTAVDNPHSVDADDVNCLSKTNTTAFTPSADYHPATKKYVDDEVANVTPVWGNITGTVSNQTDLQAALDLKANLAVVLTRTNTDVYTPSADYHPATKKYVDDSIAAIPPGTWGSITGTLSNQTDLQAALDLKANLTVVLKEDGSVPLSGDWDAGSARTISIGTISGTTGLAISTPNSSNAGDITIQAGDSSGAFNEGGDVTIQAGGGTTSTATSGDVTINGGDGTGWCNGGDATLAGGAAASNQGGSAYINGGDGSDAGHVYIRGGTASGVTNGGNINLTSGNGVSEGGILLKIYGATGTVAANTIKLAAAANYAQLTTQPTGTTDLAIATTKYVDDNGGFASNVRASLSSNQALSTGAWNKIQFNTEAYDSNSDFNTTTNRFTAPATGKYVFTMKILVTSSGDLRLGAAYDGTVNPLDELYVDDAGSTNMKMYQTTMEMTSGHYVEMQYYLVSGSGNILNTKTLLTIHRVG